MEMQHIRSMPDLLDLGAKRQAAAPSDYTFGIGAMISRLITTIKRARERRAAIAVLRRFDRRELADIGITRDEIETVVRTGQSRRMKQGL